MELSTIQSFVLEFCTRLCPGSPGVYLEVGANDGLVQSNSLALEQKLGWQGILIEASPKAFDALKVNRPGNYLAHAALVDRDFQGTSVVGDFALGTPRGKMTMAGDVQRLGPKEMVGALYKQIGKRVRGEMVEVPAKTMDSVLRDSPFQQLDFVSLDVEGHEVGVLEGCDLAGNPPSAMLIEMSPPMIWPMLELMLAHKYVLVRNVSRFSKSANPGWSQDHQDYLFLQRHLMDVADIRQFVLA
jgi:FkbM family methyltransferase